MSTRTCPSCGAPVSASARFCTACGASQPGPEPFAVAALPPPPKPTRRISALAVASLALGAASFVLWVFGLVTAPIAAALGAIARRRISEREDLSGSGLALAGMISGLVWMSLATALVTFLLMLSAGV